MPVLKRLEILEQTLTTTFLPCNQKCFVVYTCTEGDRVIDLTETAIVAWEVNDGFLKPIPADQLFAEDSHEAIRINDLYYGEFSISGQSREEVMAYFNRKLKKQSEKQKQIAKQKELETNTE
jgi:hypothetical protein